MVYFTTNVLSFSARYTFPKQGEVHDYKKYYTLKSAFHPMIKKIISLNIHSMFVDEAP
jgi:hypothetical protein